ncbi:MAG: pyruvate kinase [Pseudomonadota bacterium]
MSPSLEFHATLGPAAASGQARHALLCAGTTALRVNLSHAPGEQAAALLGELRGQARAQGFAVALGADLRGRKLRTGTLQHGQVLLQAGQDFELCPLPVDEEGVGDGARATVNCPQLGALVRPGTRILLDDGALELQVVDAAPARVRCVVLTGGPLLERVGVNLPGTALTLPALTPRDLADLDALRAQPPDHLYLSFVERAEDLVLLRRELDARGMNCRLIAKIERAAALQELPAIAAEADALCLARGDLGVEIGLARVPRAQRLVATAAQHAHTPWLLAGEVLLTTLHRPQPSRAELTDLQTALDQQVSGFVLSDETAVGPDPASAVRWLASLCREMAEAL